MPNRLARGQDLHELYSRQFLLEDSQIERIAAAMPNRDYFIHQPDMARTVRLRLDPESVAILRSDQAAQNVFDRHAASGDQNWKSNYVEELTNA